MAKQWVTISKTFKPNYNLKSNNGYYGKVVKIIKKPSSNFIPVRHVIYRNSWLNGSIKHIDFRLVEEYVNRDTINISGFNYWSTNKILAHFHVSSDFNKSVEVTNMSQYDLSQRYPVFHGKTIPVKSYSQGINYILKLFRKIN